MRGEVVNKLLLLDTAHIHPVFHTSLLKLCLNLSTGIPLHLPSSADQFPVPLCILAQQIVKDNGKKEIVVSGRRLRLQKIAIGEDHRFWRLSQLENIAIRAWRYGVILGELWCLSSCCYGLELSDIMMCIGLNMDSASGGCDEGYSINIGVEGSACDMEISPGMTKYWRPNCAESLKPHVGQQFVSLDTAFGFYKQYAGSVGFDCRQSTTRKGRDDGVVLKQVVCSREGFKKSSSSTSSTTQSNVVKRHLTSRDPSSTSLLKHSTGPCFLSPTHSPNALISPFLHCTHDLVNCIEEFWVTPKCVFLLIAVGAFSTSLPTFNSPVAIVLVLLVLELLDSPPQVVQFYHEEENWSSIELVCALHPHLLAIDQCIDDQLTPIQICRAKWRLNHRSAASTSSIFLFNAFGVIYAVVFSKHHLHSFNISGIAFTVLFVISIFPFGRPRTAATSSAVIWIVCPFWSFNVQLLGLKFSTNHSPIWRGKLVICRSRRLPNPMSFTAWRCAGFSCSTVVHPFPLDCQPPLLGPVVLLQYALVVPVVPLQWVVPLVALVRALQWMLGALCLLISTQPVTPNNSKPKPSLGAAAAPRVSRVSRGAAKSDGDAAPTQLQPARSSVDKNSRPVTSLKPAVDRRSPKLSSTSTPPDKKPTRVSKPSELQAELNLAQDDLKKAKENLASVEKEKAQALDDLKEAQKLAEEANKKLKEALMAQKQAEENSELEKFRAVEMEQAGIEASQRKEEEWQKEVEAVRSQHALDTAALLSATQELERVKQELAVACDAKNQALSHADEAAKIAEMQVGKVETLSAELAQVNSLLESKLETEANEKNELVAELDLEIEALKREVEKAKHYEERLVDKEAILEQLNVDLEAAKMAESYAQNLVKEWKKKVEDLEVQAAEAHRLERSASESLESIMKQLEDSNDLLHDAESEIESLKEKVGLLEISIGRQKGDLEESKRHIKMAKEEASDMAEKVESLSFEIETIKEEKILALNNEKLAADSVQQLLASALHEVSSEAREAKERLLSGQVEHENFETQMEDLRLVLKATNEKYENMLDDAKHEIDLLSVAVEESKLSFQNLKAECEEKEMNLMNSVKRNEDENSSMEKEISRLEILLKEAQKEAYVAKDEEANLKNSLKKVESEVNHLKEALGETKAESMKLKESLMDKENEMQNILQVNEELRSREATSLKKAEELSKMLEEALATNKLAEENGEELTDSEKDYDMLPKVVEFSEQNGGREENPKMEIPHQSHHFVIKEFQEVNNTCANEDKETDRAGGLDEKAKENESKEKDDTDSVEADLKTWESCKIEEKDFSPEGEPEHEEELESKTEVGENHDHQNGVSPTENHNTSPSKQQSQKKKKALLGKFGSLLKKKGTSNQKQ
nr:WEB family protein At3g02930, chloroplastic-like [Ipomoea batatas]